MKRIFIMSSERSGSNLLHRILGSHETGISPVAVHFTTNLAKWSPYYFPGSVNRTELLVTDMLLLAKSHIVPWKYEIEASQVMEKIEKNSFWGVMVALYDVIAARNNKVFWVCKDNALFDYAAEIIGQFPDARFIYLARDGRDVALSFMEVPGGPNTLTDAGKLWVHEQRKCLRLSHLYPDNMYRIRYEEIIQSPVDTIRQLCGFLDIPYMENMQEFYTDTEKEYKDSVYWSNLNKPLMQKNMEKWKKGMSMKERYYYQQLEGGECGMVLSLLGYEVYENVPAMPLYTRFKCMVDCFMKAFFFIYYRIIRPEGKARLPKKNMIRKIKKDLAGFMVE